MPHILATNVSALRAGHSGIRGVRSGSDYVTTNHTRVAEQRREPIPGEGQWSRSIMPSRNNELLRGKAAADVSASARICRLIRPRHYNESAPYASRAPDMPPPPPPMSSRNDATCVTRTRNERKWGIAICLCPIPDAYPRYIQPIVIKEMSGRRCSWKAAYAAPTWPDVASVRMRRARCRQVYLARRRL